MAESISAVASPSDTSDNDPGESNEDPYISNQQVQGEQPEATLDVAAASLNSPKSLVGPHCTFDQPSNRRRNPAPQYVEALEIRLQKAEQLLREVRPDVNLDDPMHGVAIPQRTHAPFRPGGQSPAVTPTSSESQPTLSEAIAKTEEDSVLESMVHEAGSLALDDQGHWDFYGHSSGMIFLRRMREQFGDLLGKPEGTNYFFKSSSVSERFSTPRSASASPMNPGLTNVHDLPAKECARKLCSCALDDAAALLRFVHQPSFYESFERVYETPPEGLTPADQKFLPLLYSILALGCLFANAEESMLQSFGFNWFQISRQLMDVTDCRDLVSLQALLFMIMFLQASARLSTCFSHIGIALRSAIRMGLHRRVSNKFSPIEQESRKRTFWVIRNMDMYVGAILGLPMMLSDEDIDQDFPLEVDDFCITAGAVLPMPSGKTSLMTAFNAHIRLVRLLAKTVRYVYPLQTTRDKNKDAYVVNYAKIREVEQNLHRWMEDLPVALRPGGEAPPELVRVQQLLRIAYGHTQIMLYRPFLHYVSQSIQIRHADKRAYACAAACVSVSRNIIHITSEMKRRGLLTGAYWFTMYTTFFAVLALLFYVVENPHNAASHGILRDAHEGRDTLASLASRSMAADRSSKTLKDLFDQLPEAVKTGRLSYTSQNKRSAPMHNLEPTKVETPSYTTVRKSNMHSPAEWSSTSSGVEESDGKQTSRTYPGPTVLMQPISDFESGSIGNAPQTFRDSPSTAVNFPINSSAAGSVPSSAMPIGYSPNAARFSGVPTLMPMVFPSNDPFAYPNQPMSTLEDYQDGDQNQPFGWQRFNDGTNSGCYDNLSAPFYGSVPSYPVQSTESSTNMGENLVDGENRKFGDNQAWAPQQQTRYGGTAIGANWDAIFGEDWSGGWTDQGYRR
ncbi:MAG: hypothetical protein Q9219_003122 [cf. Caloplaca sp. 3 TL-2023]